MNLYEFEGKQLFEKYGIKIPRGFIVRPGDDYEKLYTDFGIQDVVIKAQVLSGKRGKGGGIKFASNAEEVKKACEEIFALDLRGQLVVAIRIEEKIDILEEHYLSITYNTNKKQPVLVYSREGGMDIEEVSEEKIIQYSLDVRKEKFDENFSFPKPENGELVVLPAEGGDQKLLEIQNKLWQLFLHEDTRLVEINPLVKTKSGEWIAADSKIALDDDAFYRHDEWKNFESRTMLGRLPTERETEAKKIDEGEGYYRGTAGKYIEMEGDTAILFSSGGGSISNMDALAQAGLHAANYTEYSGNPPREKVAALAKVVLSKPGLRGLWIAGPVANFTNVVETFQGIIDVLDELKPQYPIVVRRGGPFEKEGLELMEECAKRNGLRMKLFGKETSMSETAKILADMINT